MPISFSRSLRALQADRFRRPTLGMLAGLLLFAAWGSWFFFSEVSVYAVTDQARLEVDQAVHDIEAPISGRVMAVHIELGQELDAGAVLFELDAEAQRLELEERRADRASLEEQLAAQRQVLSTGEQARRQNQEAASASLAEAQARYEEAEATAVQAEKEAERHRELFASQTVSASEYERAAAEAQTKRAAAEALRLGRTRIDLNLQTANQDRRTDQDALRREIARLTGEINTATAAINRLEHEISQRQITAAVGGRIGEVMDLRAGAFVDAGDQLGSIVPKGQLRAIAYFVSSDAVGRIQPGQPAQVRLDAFPWTQYGSVAATVHRVASELQDGRVRVELNVDPTSNTMIPLQHGLPGALEVQVDRVSPAELVLRNAGKLLRT